MKGNILISASHSPPEVFLSLDFSGNSATTPPIDLGVSSLGASPTSSANAGAVHHHSRISDLHGSFLPVAEIPSMAEPDVALCGLTAGLASHHATLALDHTMVTEIPDLYRASHELLQSIRMEFEDVEPGIVIAHFREADLSMTGVSRSDAVDSLQSWIFDIFDSLTSVDRDTLGATPAAQIRVLNRYIRRRL